MNNTENSILKMISSSDKENSYLAACILRSKESGIDKKTTRKLLKKMPLTDRIRFYSDVCEELEEEQLTLDDFKSLPRYLRKKHLAYGKLLQVAKLLNGNWKPDYSDTSQEKWYPYFDYKQGRGLVFSDSYGHPGLFYGVAALYKSREMSDFAGKTFLD